MMNVKKSEMRSMVKGKRIGIRSLLVLEIIGKGKMRSCEVIKKMRGLSEKYGEIVGDNLWEFNEREFLFYMWKKGWLEREGVGEKLISNNDVRRRIRLGEIGYWVNSKKRGSKFWKSDEEMVVYIKDFIEGEYMVEEGGDELRMRWVKERWYRVSEVGLKMLGVYSEEDRIKMLRKFKKDRKIGYLLLDMKNRKESIKFYREEIEKGEKKLWGGSSYEDEIRNKEKDIEEIKRKIKEVSEGYRVKEIEDGLIIVEGYGERWRLEYEDCCECNLNCEMKNVKVGDEVWLECKKKRRCEIVGNEFEDLKKRFLGDKTPSPTRNEVPSSGATSSKYFR